MIDRLKEKAQAWLAERGYFVGRYPAAMTRNRSRMLSMNLDLDFIVGHYMLRRDRSSDVRFVQVGAFDGVSGDPIYDYVRKFGWKGALVEPQERYFSALKENYSQVPGVQLFNVGITAERGEKTLYSIKNPEAAHLPAWAAQVASFSREKLLWHRDKIPDLQIAEQSVRCITFEDLLTEAGLDHLDLVQIDAEGYDYEVLKMIDFEKTSPSIVSFEHKHLSTKERNEAIDLLVEKNFLVLKEGPDIIGYRP